MKHTRLWIIAIAVLVTALIATVLFKFGATLSDDYQYTKRGEQDCFCWDRTGESSVNWR